MNITEVTAQRLNDNIERLIEILEPKKSKQSKSETDRDRIEEYKKQIQAKYAKKHLKNLINNK